MPQVPRYDEQKVQSQNLPGVKIQDVSNAAAFGMGQGQAKLNKAQDEVVGSISKYVEIEKKHADEVSFLEFDKKLSEYQVQTEYGQGGVYSKKGKDALSSHEELETNWNKTTTQMIDELPSWQQDKARARVNQRWGSINEGAQRHAFSEKTKYDNELTKSYIANSQNEAQHNFTNPDRVKQSIEEQKLVINQHLDRNGIKDDAIRKNTIDEAVGKTHALVISKYADSDNDVLAQKYYDDHKDEITGQAETQVTKLLEESSTKGKSQRLSAEIIKSTKTYGEALAKARTVGKTEGSKIQDATVARVKDFYSEKKLAERDLYEDLTNSASRIIDSTKNYDAIPNYIKSQLPLNDKKALQNYAETSAKGAQTPTDWGKYTELRDMASNPKTQQEFADMNPLMYRNSLDDSKFSEMVKLRDGIRKGHPDTLKLLEGVRSKTQIVNDTLNKIDVTKKSNPEQYDSFYRKVDQQVEELQASTGKKASSADIQKIVDSLTIEGVTSKGWLWDTKKKAYELAPGEKFQVDTSAQREKAIAHLKSKGMAVTEKNINYLIGAKSGK